MLLGCVLTYTQYLTRPGTPLTGFSVVSEAKKYVAVLPLVAKVAVTLLAALKAASPLLGQPLLISDLARAGRVNRHTSVSKQINLFIINLSS
jgi:hypothetical protein